MKKTIVITFFIISISGCTSLDKTSDNKFVTAPLMGMLYTSEGLAADEVNIFFDGKAAAVSDINGRFVIPEVNRGRHQFEFRKEGMETLTTELDFRNPTQILYASMIPLDEILEELEEALKQNRLADAANLIKRGSAVKKDDLRLEYLRIVYLVKKGELDTASEKVMELLRMFPENRTLKMTEKYIASMTSSKSGGEQNTK